MKRAVIGCLLIVAFVAAGCATTNSTSSTNSAHDLDSLSRKEIAAYNANPENTDKIVCTNEKPVGSNIPNRVCRKESTIKDRQQQDQQVMKEHIRSAPVPPGK